MKPLLRVRDLRTTFSTNRGTARAVDGVSFDLHPGETLGLVGESGSGKTVTALSVLRLIDGSGTIEPGSVIEYQGTDLLTLDSRALRRVRGAEIAMIFQEPTASLNPVLTVGAQIVETLRAHRHVDRNEARARAVALLDRVGIPDAIERAGAYPHELSGGMQQRAMIAMALACDPRILIADEPTTALDVTIQAQILDLLADLKRQLDMALLLITHDLGIVAGVADRVAVLYGGQIVEQAETAQLFSDPRHPYTAALLAAIPSLDRPTDRLATIPGTVPAATEWPVGCRFHPRCAWAWERCRGEAPDLLPVNQHQHARCWLMDEPERRTP